MQYVKKVCLAFTLGFCCFTYAVSAEVYPKIIGGTTALPNAWPWMVGLIYKKSDTDVFCGGTLIAPQWVLTAAHCLFDEIEIGRVPSLISDFDVLINRWQLRSQEGERITLAEIVIHPGFDRSNLKHDIALIKLSHSVNISPIATLADFSPLDIAVQTDAIALGWGNLSGIKNLYPTSLQQVSLPLVSQSICQQRMRGIEETMLCAGPVEGGRDTCSGDSGGPLVVYDIERDIWQQVGVTSFGQAQCGRANTFGVYTRLKAYTQFITDTMCSALEIPPIPTLHLSLEASSMHRGETIVTAHWTISEKATGYRLNFAPYPEGWPISSMELYPSGRFSVSLPSKSAYYVAINAYHLNCRSRLSNIEFFVTP